MDLQTDHLENRHHARYISILLLFIDYETFLYFFPNQYFQKTVFFLRSCVRKLGSM